MTDGLIPPDQVQDPAELRQPGIGQGRDPERTPMQWDAALPGAGFTNGRSWLPISTDTSVRAQDSEASSMLSLYRRLLRLRRSNPELVQGAIENVAAYGDVLTYERHYRGQRLFIALNMGAADAVVQSRPGVVLLSTLAGREGQALAEGGYRLAGAEALIAAI
jgi:alpha-glucosidase